MLAQPGMQPFFVLNQGEWKMPPTPEPEPTAIEQLIAALCTALEFLLVDTPLGDIPAVASFLESILNILC
jgi:hypothetical protein